MLTYKQYRIEAKKENDRLIKKASVMTQSDECILCKRKMSSSCHSHVVPQFVLKNIAKDGKVSYGQAILGDTLIDTTKGINNAFTFRLICKECDNRRFKKYENNEFIERFDSYSEEDKQQILCSIALKNHISHIYSKLKNHNFIKLLINKDVSHYKSARLMDVKEHFKYIEELEEYMKFKKNNFQIIYNQLLNYQIPLACQTIFCIEYDLLGNKIFDSKDLNENNKVEYLYFIVFPTKTKTRVIFYYDKNHIGYNLGFINQFINLNDEEKLHILSLLLFTYSEQFFMNPIYKDRLFKDKKIRSLYQNTSYSNVTNIFYKKIVKYKKFKNYFAEENCKIID